MPSLSRENRKLLENKVAAARESAVTGARKALIALRVGDKESPADLDQKALRNQLRAYGRQLGDARQSDGTQETRRLEQACAYEHWHRMLFARFLAENDLLVNPDYGVSMSLAEIQETAREKGQDWISLASDYAQRMLLEVFRPDDPVLRVVLPPETRQELEQLLGELPAEIFAADDSLGWVYQFWQRDEKKRVNDLDIPIGAEEISPVTQLFTEDYMVLFLLHNTLGAWWTAKRNSEGKPSSLGEYEWTYLRRNSDGSPSAGSFDGWPKTARDLRILDPCMGSGHFITFAMRILVLMRQEEENLSELDAVRAVLADNIFGLELDARCSQIAAFNLALTGWRIVGRPVSLPSLNLACSGLGINASKDSWTALAGDNGLLRDTLASLYTTFQNAPTLGSLIDPTRFARPLLFAKVEEVWPLLERALEVERGNDDARELAIAAKGVLAAAKLLAEKFTLVATNVPYLGRAKQSVELSDYCGEFHSDAKADLATCFVDRCIRFCAAGGSTALVTPQSWLFQVYFKDCRARFLRTESWQLVVRLGPRAFQEITGEVVKAALLVLSRVDPSATIRFPVWNVSARRTPLDKASGLRLDQPDWRLPSELEVDLTLSLRRFARCYQGISTGDNPQMVVYFWELSDHSDWRFFQVPGEGTRLVNGRTRALRSIVLSDEYSGGAIRGRDAWGKRGVAIARIGSLAASIYDGDFFANTLPVIIPNDPSDLSAIWAFAQSEEFRLAASTVSQSLSVDNGYLEKLPVDLDHWRGVVAKSGAETFPISTSSDPTQWIFAGQPQESIVPLQVGVLRLLGYRWPRQSGHSFLDCPSLEKDGIDYHADSDGIVCLAALSGKSAAHDRLRSLLADAFGPEWSAAKLAELIGHAASLKDWLRDNFFDEHCTLFHYRPLVWHVWDGRIDGFHALVNYHKLAGPNGQGRKTLEKLIYTSLGDWIKRQRDEVSQGSDGAESRLAAALHLHSQLEKILEGEAEPQEGTGYDIFIRWKPLHEQPTGWEPDLNDGVRLNMRPWLHAKPYQAPNQKLKQGACILRCTPIKLPLGKDKGKEQPRDKEDFPWFATSQDRTNDEHFTVEQKRAARERKEQA